MQINFLSALLSALYPGIGQIKNKEIAKGFFFILLITTLLVMGFYPNSKAQIIGLILLPLVWVAGVVDASQMFFVRPGIRVSRRKLRKMLLGVVIAWLVLEMLFVPIMWSLTDRREGNNDIVPHNLQSLRSIDRSLLIGRFVPAILPRLDPDGCPSWIV